MVYIVCISCANHNIAYWTGAAWTWRHELACRFPVEAAARGAADRLNVFGYHESTTGLKITVQEYRP